MNGRTDGNTNWVTPSLLELLIAAKNHKFHHARKWKSSLDIIITRGSQLGLGLISLALSWNSKLIGIMITYWYLLPDKTGWLMVLYESCHCFCKEVVETETFWDSKFFKLSRPRPVETLKFSSCRDRDSSRLEFFKVVDTETNRDWKIKWLSRPRLIETGQKLSRPRLWRDSRFSLGGTPFRP